jgi:hypothetical protein
MRAIDHAAAAGFRSKLDYKAVCCRVATAFALVFLLLFTTQTRAQDDCYRLPGSDSLVLSPNGYPTTLCNGTPINVGMATIVSYFHLIKKDEGTVKSGEGNGGALSFEATAIGPELEGTFIGVSSRYGCPVLYTNVVNLDFKGVVIQKLSGGGIYCPGTPGRVLQLTSSEIGVSYRLYRKLINNPDSVVAMGSAISGTGGQISFPPQTATGIYFVRASNSTCIVDFGSELVYNNVSGLAVTTYTDAIVTFKWQRIPGSAGYQYAVTTSSTPPSTGAGTIDSSATFQGLSANAQYYVHVRSQCSNGQYGDWTSTAFTTRSSPPLCSNATVITGCTYPNYHSFILPAGEGAWNLYPQGVLANGKEKVFRYTPSSTGYYKLYVTNLISGSQTSVHFYFKQSSVGCNADAWRSIGSTSSWEYLDLGQLEAGVEYLILADKYETASSASFAVGLCGYTPVCLNSTALPQCAPVTVSLQSGWNHQNEFHSVVYTFTPQTSGAHYINVTAVNNGNDVVYSWKPVSLTCDSYNWTHVADVYMRGMHLIGNLQAGVPYYIKLLNEYGASNVGQTFQICKAEPPGCTALSSISTCQTASFSIPSGIGGWNPVDTISYTNSEGKEALFSFTPATTGNYAVEITSAGSLVKYFYKPVASGCGETGWSRIGQFQYSGSKNIGILQGGVAYYFLFDKVYEFGTASHSFRICKVDPPNCAAAPVLTECASATASITTGIGAWDLSDSTSAFSSSPGKELLYAFTPSVSAKYYLEVVSVTGQTYYKALEYYYKKAETGCNIGGGWKSLGYHSEPSTRLIDTLLAGVTYYFLLDNGYTNYAKTHVFRICRVAPPNCTAASNVPLCSTVTGTINAGYGGWSFVNRETSSHGIEAVYKFTPATTGYYKLKAGSTTNAYGPSQVRYMFKEASTGCSFNGWKHLGDLGAGGYKSLGLLQAGITYYVLADNIYNLYSITFSFSICKYDLPDCNTATTLTACSTATANFTSGSGAWDFTGTYPFNSTGVATPGHERLFKFTPAASGAYYIELAAQPASGTRISYLMKRSTPGCADTGWTGVARFNDDLSNSMRLGNLEAGITYYLLADNEDTTTVSQSFRICKTDPPICSTGTVIGQCSSVTANIPAGLGAWDYIGLTSGDSSYHTPGKELLYRFTPATTGYYALEVTGAGTKMVDYFIRQLSAGCSSMNWKRVGEFKATGAENLGILQAGVTYQLLLDNESQLAQTNIFKICKVDPPVCSNAAAVSVCNSVTASIPDGVGAWNFVGTYPNNSTGARTIGKESLVSFTPPTTGLYYLEVLSTSSGGPVSYLYKQASSACNDSNWVGIGRFSAPGAKNIGQLQGGIKYYILLDNENTTAVTQQLRICEVQPPNCNQSISLSAGVAMNSTILQGVGSWDFERYFTGTGSTASTPGKEVFFKFTPNKTGMYFLKLLANDSLSFLYKPASMPCDTSGWTAIGKLNSLQEKPVGVLQAGIEYLIIADNQALTANSFQIVVSDAEILCPGDLHNFYVRELNSTGFDSYSWQVDKGNGVYVTVTDDVNHNGATTSNLQLVNVPASFYGYKYRGTAKAIGGFGSFTEITDFKPIKIQNRWLGINSNWSDISNWSCNSVPDINTDVVVEAGKPFNPQVNVNTTVRNLTVQPGATVRVLNGVNLTVTGK